MNRRTFLSLAPAALAASQLPVQAATPKAVITGIAEFPPMPTAVLEYADGTYFPFHNLFVPPDPRILNGRIQIACHVADWPADTSDTPPADS